MFEIGDIGFSTSKSSPFSASIRAFTDSNISHVFIIVGKLFGKLLILEADGERVDINFLDIYLNDDAYYEVYRLPESGRIKTLKALDYTVNKFANRKYGKGQILGFVLTRIGQIFGMAPKNPIDDGEVCSELGLYYVLSCGFNILNGKDPNLVSPSDLRKAIIEIGSRLVTVKK